MRNQMSDDFLACVINNRGAAVTPLAKAGRCDLCYKRLPKNRLAVVWLEQSRTLCTDCISRKLNNFAFLGYVEKLAKKKIGSQISTLELMQGSPLGRLTIIAHSDTYILEENHGSWRVDGRGSIKKSGLALFLLMIKSINYSGGDFLSGLIRLMASHAFLKMMNNNPSLYEPLKKILIGGDKELQSGLLKVMPSMTWGRTEKLNLIGCLQNRDDDSMVDDLAVNLKKLGINDSDDLRIALEYQPMVSKLTEMYKSDELKQLQNFIYRFVPGAGTGKKLSELAFDIVKQTAEKDKIERLFAALPKPMQELVCRLLWCRTPPNYTEIEQEFNLKMTRKERYNEWSDGCYFVIEKEYKGLLELVSADGANIGFVINSWLASRFKVIMPKPAGTKLTGVDMPPDASYDIRIEYNPDFVALLPNLTSRLRQKMIPLKKSGLPSVAGCKKMEMFSGGYKEFYPENKQLRNYRSELLFRMFTQAKISKQVNLTAPVVVKALLDGLLKVSYVGEGHKFSYGYVQSNIIPALLTHLEWSYYSVTAEFVEEYLDAIKTLMIAMPKERWVMVKDALDYMFFNDIDLGSTSVVDSCSAIVEDSWGSKTYARLDVTSVANYWDEPLLKTFLMMFAAVGALEIVCGAPVSTGKCAYNKDYLSRADGVLAVKLTPLGEWYFQGGDESCFKKIEPGEIVPDKKRLLLRLRGDDITLKTTLEQTANPVGGGFYSIDSGSFLDDCKSEDAVVQKINAFKSLLPDELPEVWQSFFEKTLARLNPLKVVKAPYKVLELKDTPELKQLLITNQALRKLITLAEGGLILVAKKNIHALKKKLADLGFYVDSF